MYVGSEVVEIEFFFVFGDDGMVLKSVFFLRYFFDSCFFGLDLLGSIMEFFFFRVKLRKRVSYSSWLNFRWIIYYFFFVRSVEFLGFKGFFFVFKSVEFFENIGVDKVGDVFVIEEFGDNIVFLGVVCEYVVFCKIGLVYINILK